MIPFISSRETAQIVSISFILAGIFTLLCTTHTYISIGLFGISIWVMIMSESVLLSKVQNEMHTALEEMSRKKEIEVEQVLYFLRQSSIAASPFESVDGAKRLCKRMQSPAMVLSADYQIITANKQMHNVLKWKEGKLNGVPAYTINDPLVMSKIGEYAAKASNIDRSTITSSYVYTTSEGKKITGLMHAAKIGVEGYFVTFFPDDSFIFTREQINNFLV